MQREYTGNKHAYRSEAPAGDPNTDECYNADNALCASRPAASVPGPRSFAIGTGNMDSQAVAGRYDTLRERYYRIANCTALHSTLADGCKLQFRNGSWPLLVTFSLPEAPGAGAAKSPLDQTSCA